MKADHKRYLVISDDAFDATVPFGSNVKARWRCHAKPAALGGTCGHENVAGIRHRRVGQVDLVCCESCGCTKKASDDRERAR